MNPHRLLAAYAVLYAATLLVAGSPWTALAAVALGAGVLAVGLGVQASFGGRARAPGPLGVRLIAVTAALEGVALAAALVLGAVTGVWWPALPIVLSAVTVHVLVLGASIRRPLDAWLGVCLLAATVAAWLWSAGALPTVWPLAGAAASGACLAYAIVLARAARAARAAPASVPGVDELQADDAADEAHEQQDLHP
ncbi:hypothetical protein [Agromyces archimandritae]|uniref:Uncharacterized protein n=1 Tax=Agromyces archimandritae TaxID=2781962 RepID=A0A975FN49_9MICO|nr:hypothetical protein [Agromyces archimandritae]QTX04066.1 hypothetical protein G127AT_12295 [Agromyces archimandritae]